MTTKQRAALRAMANTMEPVLQIGKDGITDNLVKQCWDALEARELIKVNVQKNAPYVAREACEELCERVHAEPVQTIGNRFTIYRQARAFKNPPGGSLKSQMGCKSEHTTDLQSLFQPRFTRPWLSLSA